MLFLDEDKKGKKGMSLLRWFKSISGLSINEDKIKVIKSGALSVFFGILFFVIFMPIVAN